MSKMREQKKSLWGKGKETDTVKKQWRKEKWMNKNEWVEQKSCFCRRNARKKKKGRKSRAINKRNETVGMKGGTWKWHKTAQGTQIGRNKHSLIYSYLYILCYLPSKHPRAPQATYFWGAVKWGMGWQHGGGGGFTSALLSSWITGHLLIEITQGSGWHFFRNINTLCGIERKIYFKKTQQNTTKAKSNKPEKIQRRKYRCEEGIGVICQSLSADCKYSAPVDHQTLFAVWMTCETEQGCDFSFLSIALTPD